MYRYERCIGGKYLNIHGGDRKRFLTSVIVDATEYAYRFLPWDVDDVYASLPNDWNGFFRGAKSLNRRLKRKGLGRDEVRLARPIIVMKKAIELLGLGVEGECPRTCDREFVYFVFIEDAKRRAIKRFTFGERAEDVDKFRAFASVQASAIIKLCDVKKDTHSFDEQNASICDVVSVLSGLGVNPVIDIKKLDRYLTSL